jgi:hypothetical protein
MRHDTENIYSLDEKKISASRLLLTLGGYRVTFGISIGADGRFKKREVRIIKFVARSPLTVYFCRVADIGEK